MITKEQDDLNARICQVCFGIPDHLIVRSYGKKSITMQEIMENIQRDNVLS